MKMFNSVRLALTLLNSRAALILFFVVLAHFITNSTTDDVVETTILLVDSSLNSTSTLPEISTLAEILTLPEILTLAETSTETSTLASTSAPRPRKFQFEIYPGNTYTYTLKVDNTDKLEFRIIMPCNVCIGSVFLQTNFETIQGGDSATTCKIMELNWNESYFVVKESRNTAESLININSRYGSIMTMTYDTAKSNDNIRVETIPFSYPCAPKFDGGTDGQPYYFTLNVSASGFDDCKAEIALVGAEKFEPIVRSEYTEKLDLNTSSTTKTKLAATIAVDGEEMTATMPDNESMTDAPINESTMVSGKALLCPLTTCSPCPTKCDCSASNSTQQTCPKPENKFLQMPFLVSGAINLLLIVIIIVLIIFLVKAYRKKKLSTNDNEALDEENEENEEENGKIKKREEKEKEEKKEKEKVKKDEKKKKKESAPKSKSSDSGSRSPSSSASDRSDNREEAKSSKRSGSSKKKAKK